MADEEGNYLNPLTLEAHLFLKTMEGLTKSFHQIDMNLCGTLEKVVDSIVRFLGSQPTPIVTTEKTKLVEVDDLSCIQHSYNCNVCKQYLGKKVSSAATHFMDKHSQKSSIDATKSSTNKERLQVSKTRRQLEKAKKANAVVNISKKVKALISNDFTAFFKDHILIAEKLKKLTLYEDMEKDLLSLVQPLFPDQTVKLWKFGSRITGIGTRNSDLDIFVEIGNNFNTFENRSSQETLKSLHRVRDGIQKSKKTWSRLVVIDNARVPILKVCHNNTTIECDIGFSNSLGFCNTKLMEFLFDLQPIGRRMCIFLKCWHDRAKLKENLSTYCICLLVIYFLQVGKFLPSIEQLQCEMPEVVLVGPWISNFIPKPLTDFDIKRMDTSNDICRFMLKSFFAYYSVFDFGVDVVSPYFGRRMEIKDIESALPKRYTEYLANGDAVRDDGLQLKKPMVVQDPIQLNHNVTKGINAVTLKHIQVLFRQSNDAFGDD